MTLPDWRAWLFSFRSFMAATLALYIAFAADLPRPYWALASVYIASQPLSGATQSRAFFRFLGTLLGGTAAVALVPNLVDTPTLLSLALAGWVGFCLFLALLDRTPRSYVFMLGGYTAAIIGFPSVSAPSQIFDTAISRVEEIGIGIFSASLVHSLFFPASVGPVVAMRIREAMRVCQRWGEAALAGDADPAEVHQNRRRLAGVASELDLLDSFLAWDPTARAAAGRPVQNFRLRLLLAMPVITSIRDRVHALKLAGAVSPSLEELLHSVRDMLRHSAGLATTGEALRRRIDELEAGLELGGDWGRFLVASLLLRLRNLTQLWQDGWAIEREIRHPDAPVPTMLYRTEAEASRVRLVDPGMALWSGLATAFAILICCALWIYGAWDDGAVAAELLAVVCSFFAAQDDPVPMIVGFLKWTSVALVIDIVLLFAVLPQVNGFPLLILALAPSYLFCGALIATPRYAAIGTAILVVGSTLMSLDSAYDSDFPTFINAGIAAILGMVIAAVVTAITRSVGAEWSARRLMRRAWRELESAARHRGAEDRHIFVARFLDGLSLLMPRLAGVDTHGDNSASAFLTDLRTGFNIVDLRRARHLLPAAPRAAIDTMLDALAEHFRRRAEGRETDTTPLLLRIDAALSELTLLPDDAGRRDALLGLVGIRATLCPRAAPYQPPPPSPPAATQEMEQAV